MKDQNHKDRIIEWLGQPENEQWLDRLSWSAMKRLRRENLLAGFLGESFRDTLSAAGYGREAAGRDAADAVKSELFVFLTESRRAMEVMTAAYNGSGGYLITAFVNHCREKCRDITVSPRKYFRRSALTVIRESEELAAGSGDAGARERYSSIYGRAQHPGGVLDPLSDDEKQKIPFTLGCLEVFSGARKDAICNHKALFHALCWFLDQAGELKQAPGSWARIDDFMDWLMANRPADLPIGPDMHRPMLYPDDQGTAVLFEETLADSRQRPDRQWNDPEIVSSWARKCVALLTDIESDLLCQKFVYNRNPGQIAENRGDMSRNTADKYIRHAQSKIFSFLADKPLVSFDDLHEEAFSLFMENLKQELKNATSVP